MQFSTEQLFGSKVRVRLLRLFLEHPGEKFYIREITRLIKSHINAVRRELQNLEKIGVIKSYNDETSARNNRRYVEVDQNFILFNELRSFILKSQILLQSDFAKELQARGDIDYLSFTGSFVGAKDCPTDLVVIGRLKRDYCAKLVKSFEEELGRPLNYTLMTLDEYEQRKKMTDRFIYQILENNKIVLIDKLNKI